MPTYGPPQGDKVALTFPAGTYTPPQGDRVNLELDPTVGPPPSTQYITCFGWVSPAYGTPSLANEFEYITPTGWVSSTVDGPSIQLGTRYVVPANWTSSTYGTGSILNLTFQAFPGGIAPYPLTGPNQFREVPSPVVDYRTRYLFVSAISGGAVGAHLITQEIQYVDQAGRGIAAGTPGTLLIAYSLRTVAPPFIASMVFGNHNVARIQNVLPTGWQSSTFSSNAELDINLQRLLHHSGAADPAGYGVQTVRNEHELLFPQTILPGEPGFPQVQLFDRYVTVGPFANNVDPDEWPNYSPFVENFNRVLGPGGWRSSRFSVIGTFVENGARALLPDGLDSLTFGPTTFISYRDRTVAAASWIDSYSSQYHVVHNDARVVAPSGWASARLGVPTQVLNLNRTVLQHSGWVGPVWGLPFIADGVRNVFPNLFIEPPNGIPEVRLNPYPIAPAGIDSYRTGGHDLQIHFNIIRAPSVNVRPVPSPGEPFIQNRNKTLLVFPSDQSLYGLAKVFLYTRYYPLAGWDSFAMSGLHNISYRTKVMVPQAISPPTFTVIHRVANELPDPPFARTLLAQSIPRNPFLPEVIPAPAFNYATIFPNGIPAPTPGFGQSTLTRNGIFPNTIIGLLQFGTPTLIFTQFVGAIGAPWPRPGYTNADGSVGESDLYSHDSKPRLTPHTIYAPYGDQATNQARNNHPVGDYQIIDQYPVNGQPWWGNATVSLFNRTIGPVPHHGGSSGLAGSSKVGAPDLMLRMRRIFARPHMSQRFGLPLFLNVPQYVTFEWYGGFASDVYGEPTVARPVVREQPQPTGWVSSSFGNNRVELLNREVAPTGVPHRGNPEENMTNPWGTPLVGFPRVYSWTGGVMTLWGTARVEHKIRNLYPTGWVSSLDSVDDLSSFRDRMRVIRRNVPGQIPSLPSTNVFGQPLIALAIRSILGRGISSYNAGDHTVNMVIFTAGWDSFEAGDIDEWEAGKIKPHGDDLSSLGTPRLVHPFALAGIDESEVPDPRVAMGVYVAGMPPVGFDGPSLTDIYGCNNRVVSPLPALSQQVVPQPVVTN